MKKFIASASLIVAACGSSNSNDDVGFDKAIEGRLYDRAAEIVSDICADVYDRGLWVQRTRAEVRREIRQRGRYGPGKPDHLPDSVKEGLGEKTFAGRGPVMRIYCEGEEDDIPDEVWKDLVRTWQD
jgi:hypothetical protein